MTLTPHVTFSPSSRASRMTSSEAAQEIFDRHGAFDVDERGSSNYSGAENFSATSETDTTNTGGANTDLTDRQTIPVVARNRHVVLADTGAGFLSLGRTDPSVTPAPTPETETYTLWPRASNLKPHATILSS